MIDSGKVVSGMTVLINGKAFSVKDCTKVTVASGIPFVKVTLTDLISGKIEEKHFPLDQSIEDICLVRRKMQYLYREGKKYLFLDIDSLETILVDANTIGKGIKYLKPDFMVTGLCYGDNVFSVLINQFVDLMVSKVESVKDNMGLSVGSHCMATLETGASVMVPMFVESGDIISIDTVNNEYVRRI